MSRLTDYSLLSFDVYGTLIDWEKGVLEALKPLLAKDPDREVTSKQLLETYEKNEKMQQKSTPDMVYSQLLATIHPLIAAELGLPEPTTEESKLFGQAIGSWSPFPDTVDALKRLSKTYKLVVLSNVDRESFSATNAGPLKGVNFDAILTAQDIGSYKPDRRNFEYMMRVAKEKFGIEKGQILKTAQSQHHDHTPASKLGIKSVWIARSGAVMGYGGKDSEAIYDWKFETLGQMADAVDKEKEEK